MRHKAKVIAIEGNIVVLKVERALDSLCTPLAVVLNTDYRGANSNHTSMDTISKMVEDKVEELEQRMGNQEALHPYGQHRVVEPEREGTMSPDLHDYIVKVAQKEELSFLAAKRWLMEVGREALESDYPQEEEL